MIKVLIIEDEIKTARSLKKMIEATVGYEVVEIVPSVRSAVQWLSQNSPSLIISDIQLADGLSFDIFRTIQPKAPVIFCTAYDEYAIRAFETNGIDYLLKPIDVEKLNKSLEKFRGFSELFIVGQQDYSGQMQVFLSRMDNNYKTTLLVHHRERIIPLKVNEVCFANSENGIVTLYVNDGNRYVVNYTLDELEGMFDPKQFFRANRQFIINKSCISVAEHYFSRRLLLKLSVKAPTEIVISKARVPEFLSWMED